MGAKGLHTRTHLSSRTCSPSVTQSYSMLCSDLPSSRSTSHSSSVVFFSSLASLPLAWALPCLQRDWQCVPANLRGEGPLCTYPPPLFHAPSITLAQTRKHKHKHEHAHTRTQTRFLLPLPSPPPPQRPPVYPSTLAHLHKKANETPSSPIPLSHCSPSTLQHTPGCARQEAQTTLLRSR